MYFTFGKAFTVCNPFFYTGYRFLRRGEAGAKSFFRLLQNVDQDIIPFSIGNDDGNAFVGYFACDVGLCQHAASAKTRLTGLYIARQVFAVADFPVPKSGDLHSAGVPPVTLRAERRVAKFRVLLKDKPSPVNGFSFDMTAHTVQMLLTSKTEPFAEGIDALGGMYYGDPALYELPCCMSTMGDFHSSGTERYQMCQTNSTVFSPFVFADPASELPIGILDIDISGASGGYTYKTDQTFARTLAASKISGIVFETTDTYDDSSSQIRIDVVEATDDAGNPENAAALFDSFFEWNASPY